MAEHYGVTPVPSKREVLVLVNDYGQAVHTYLTPEEAREMAAELTQAANEMEAQRDD